MTKGAELSPESFVSAPDGTKLYVRQRAAGQAWQPEDAPASVRFPSSGRMRVASGAGDRPLTAILSDGIACDGFIWKYLWDLLADHMAVAHWHYRGHGRSGSPVDEQAIDVPALAHDLTAVRAALGSPPSVLFGHSMGCQVVLENYLQNAEQVRGLVLLCGSAGEITQTFRGTNLLAQVLPKAIGQVERSPELARALWSRIPHEVALRVALLTGEVDPRTLKPEDLRPYLQHMTHIDLLMFLRMLRSAGEHSTRERLGEIRCPVLVVAGEKDQFTPAHLAEEIARRIPNADLLVVPGATHVAPLEQRDVVHLAVLKFLRERV
ncbi:MAG: alpha/beta hydrolase, partial [Myxococcales bacterium]